MAKTIKNSKSGFSLIELMVSMSIILTLTLGLHSLIVISLKLTADNKSYVEATEIANQKMEQINNLSYDDIGTISGSPSGVIPEYEQVSREGEYTIHTSVVFYDDPYDGTMSAGTDTIFVDYKIVTIEVSWQGKYEKKDITIFSKIIPKTEETLAGYGLMKIITVDANGNPITGANIHIQNQDSGLDVTLNSNNEGKLDYPVLPGIENYKITVTKNDFGKSETFSRTAPNLNPTKPNLSIFEGVKTEESFSIDKLAKLEITTVTNNLPENKKISETITSRNQIKPSLSNDALKNIYYTWENWSATSSYISLLKFNSNFNELWADKVTINSSDSGSNPNIQTTSNGTSLIVWDDNKNGNRDIFLSILSNSGNKIINEQKINTEAGNDDQILPQIALNKTSGTSTAIVWEDNRNGNSDIYAQILTTTGVTMRLFDLEVSTSTVNEYSPAVTFDSKENIIIAWVSNDTDGKNIYAQKFEIPGIPLWPTPKKITSSSTPEHSPFIINSEENIIISWTEEGTSSKNTFISLLDKDGTPQWQKRTNREQLNADQYNNSLSLLENNIYVSWTDTREGNLNIYSQKISIDGNHQWTNDQRINVNTGTPTQDKSKLINNTDQIICSWQDNRIGEYSIYTAKINDPNSPTTLANTPLIISGTKKIGENPIILEYEKHLYTDANGKLLLDLEWDVPGYNIEINSASSSLNIIQRSPITPIQLLPGENKKITIYAE